MIFHIGETESTNILAREGRHGDVFWADVQTAGRGRLDHKWCSSPGDSLTFSVVLDVSGMDAAALATFPLVAGLAVAKWLREKGIDAKIKWPNDILVSGRKICGILCELCDAKIICGIGVNVNESEFPPPLANRATSIFLETNTKCKISPEALVKILFEFFEIWKTKGLSAFLPEIARLDVLKGKFVKVMRTDTDDSPYSGLCGGIQEDGTLLVGNESIPAGEAHIRRDFFDKMDKVFQD